MIEIRFGNGVRGVAKIWAAGVVKKTLLIEKAAGEAVGVLLTDNKEIRRINKKFLKHDYATDVISFGAEEPGYLGDLVVSVEMAKSIAAELKITFKEELARYLVHGTLHLLGHDDKKEKPRKKMHALQEKIVAKVK